MDLVMAPERKDDGIRIWIEEDQTTLYRALRPPPKKPRKNALFRWLILFSVLVTVASWYAVSHSRHSVMQLSTDPPAEFMVARPEWNAKRRESEQQLARGYWDCVAKVVQWRYHYSLTLPPEPPEEFRVDPSALSNPAAATPESREYYWQKLREVWPTAWKEVYVWDPGWFSDLVKKLQSKVPSNLGL
jgi:hypothetical protein